MKKIIKLSIAFSIIFLISSFFVFSQLNLTNTVVSLTGRFIDEISKKPVAVVIEVFDDNNKVVYSTKSNSLTGEYYITGLKPGGKYTIKITDFKYFKQNFSFEIPYTDKYVEYSRDFQIKPKEKKAKFFLQVPPFELNKSRLRYGADFFLQDMLKTLKDNPKIKFEIVCYPDNNNNYNNNKILTKERCLALKKFFEDNEIKSDRITIKENEKTDPLNPEPTTKRAKGKRYIGSTYIIIKTY